MRVLTYIFLLLIHTIVYSQDINKKKIVYLTSDMKVPFWQTMARGIKDIINESDYQYELYDSQNSIKKELELTVKALKEEVAGIIISPINSSSCVTVLNLAKKADIPVIISDIGAESNDYISYISSNNYMGAYKIGQILSKKMYEKNWQDAKVGIIAIPQKRINGQERTAGFISALSKTNIKSAVIKQLKTWNEEESFEFTKSMVEEFPRLRAIWLQTSSIYKGVIKALKHLNKENEILLVAFDAEPEFLELIPKEVFLASGMQQPYLMGKISALNMIKHLKGEKIRKNIQIPILIISNGTISNNVDTIKLNVLGIKK